MTATEKDTRIADLLAALDDANVREQQAVARAGRAEAERDAQTAQCEYWKGLHEKSEGKRADAEAERDEWRQTVKERDRRIEKLENRAASETARADTWRERCRGNQGRVRRAARVIADTRAERNAALTHLQAVRDIAGHWEVSNERVERIAGGIIRRALDGDTL